MCLTVSDISEAPIFLKWKMKLRNPNLVFALRLSTYLTKKIAFLPRKNVYIKKYMETLVLIDLFFNLCTCLYFRCTFYVSCIFLAYFEVGLTGADSAFVIRGGPNSEHFLSNLRKLLKRGRFFLTTQSLIVKRN